MTDWYKKAFGADYAARYAHRDQAEARLTLELFQRATELAPPARLLDLGCGAGRHAAELARRGFRVAGLDLSAELLALAAADADANNDAGAGALARGDMAALPFADGVFDGALSLFTSFGYYRDDEQNEAVIGEVARTLRPGGAFFFDFLNRPHVEANLEPRTERRAADGSLLIEARQIDAATGRVEKTVRIVQADGRESERFESVRLFAREELERIFTARGLTVAAAYGDYDGAAWSPRSPRLILAARKGSAASR